MLIVGVIVYLVSVWQFSPWLSHLALMLGLLCLDIGKVREFALGDHCGLDGIIGDHDASARVGQH